MNSYFEIDPSCRAEKPRRVITDLFAVCLTNPLECPHKVDVDGLRLCFHPGRDQIITRTDIIWYKNTPGQNPDSPADVAGKPGA